MNRMQATRADIFRLFVHTGGELAIACDGVFAEVQLYAFGLEQRHILLDQRVLWFRKNADKIRFGRATAVPPESASAPAIPESGRKAWLRETLPPQ